MSNSKKECRTWRKYRRLLLVLLSSQKSRITALQLCASKRRTMRYHDKRLYAVESKNQLVAVPTTTTTTTTTTVTGERKRREDLLVAKARRSYDPEASEKLFWRQPSRWLVRNAQIFVPLALFGTRVAVDILIFDAEEKHRPQRAKELTEIISKLGPAIIKAGQALASRPDLLPSEYLNELQKLQDRVPPFETRQALERVELSLGLPKNGFSSIFELLEEEPVAAASIGQVYRARLKKGDDQGAIVALKVQRPKCEEIITLDLFILRWWARRITDFLQIFFGRDLDLVSVIQDFGEIIFREIDYVAEAENARQFSLLYADFERQGLVKIPRIYEEFTTNEVLTMEWIEGSRLVDGAGLVRLTGNAETPARIIDTLVQCSLRQMLDLGFFHADPHGGNLLATQEGRLVYLDFGMMSYLDEAQRLAIIEAVVHLVNRDFEALADLYVRMGFIAPNVDTRPIVVGLATALPDVLDASVAELNVKNVVSKLGDVMYTFPFRLPPFYIAIIRCLGVLEGVAIQVDPDFRIVSDAYPYIASRLLTDDSPELKSALRRLLFKDDLPQWARFEALLERASGSAVYDGAKVVHVLVDLLVGPEASNQLRAALVADIVDALDHLGTDAARSTIKLFTGIQLPPPPPIATRGFPLFILDATDNLVPNEQDTLPPPATETILKATKAVQSQGATAIANFDSAAAAVENLREYAPLVQRITNEPALRRMAAEVAAAVTERAASRAIRLAFLPLSNSVSPSSTL
uniref:Protein kinase domain-containing protein n=2 Tax=Aureoumbra lagunensis TaxID=44058 RepID=A0A7S3JTP8_9STRA